jgi:16S rRNA (adenine1518-N6/adenine1519-N6)-dimethyltransferase
LSRHARKRFGQNFLIDENVIRRIVDTIAPRRGELLIEIGPGKAALTRSLLDSGADMVVVEIDRDLAADLEQRFAGQQRLHIHNADALQTDFGALAQGRPYRLAGNLPYNISTPLIFHLLDQQQTPLDMHLMLQKEVVQRMASAPGGRNYGRLSVMCQNRCEISPLFEIGPASFEPRPRVDSVFVRLLPRPVSMSGPELQAALEQVVRQAFSKRRKTLRNSLSGLLTADQILDAGADPGFRAEQLSIEQFLALAARYKSTAKR